uniref:Uncharacterized protein n=1 Tax=Acrobeloides nanus TaxID=290746 RepID=A0A914DII9_9BILA
MSRMSGTTSAASGIHSAYSSYDSQQTEEQKLLYHLLRQYEKAVRPVRNASSTITVKLGMTLTNLFDLDEKKQVLTINVWLDQEWKDELLRWDPKEFGGIESLRIPCDLIWLPDLVLYNNADDYTVGYMRARAMVFYDGTVFWPPPTQLRSTCRISVTYFPFDSQRCSLKFGSWTYHGFQVDVTNRSSSVDLSNYVTSGEFELVKVHQKRRVITYSCCPEPYPDITFYIHIRRKTLYYFYNVIFPCALLSILTLLVFFLPPDSGEKIALGITVLLAFSVFMLAIAEKMPETSDSVPLIGMYLTAVMTLTSCSVILTVMILNFHHRGPFNKPVPKWARSLVLDKLRRLLRMKLEPVIIGDYSLSGVTSNGVIRRISTRLDSNDFILSNLNHEAENQLHETTEFLGLDTSGGDAAVIRKKKKKMSELHQQLLRTLQSLMKKQDGEDKGQMKAHEWRQVAQVIDRLFFWIFLIATASITCLLLVIIPYVYHSNESDEFDESLYGLP